MLGDAKLLGGPSQPAFAEYMSSFDSKDYGPALKSLLAGAPLNEIGPGKQNSQALAGLQALTPESLAAGRILHDRQMALACIAGLWLRHDYPDQSHGISQGLDMAEGSYWHGILHRREPDFGNAKYWLRRVPTHAIHLPLLVAARVLANEAKVPSPAAFLLEEEAWDSQRFVDLCEEALDASPPLHTLVKKIQLIEWELLFNHCFALAVGK